MGERAETLRTVSAEGVPSTQRNPDNLVNAPNRAYG